MTARDVQIVTLVCETCSVHKAAEKLFLAPQTVSSIIKRVEKELGVVLFTRGVEGTIMTPNGHIFYEKSRQFVDFMSDMENAFRLDPKNQHGTLRIASAIGIMATLGVESIWRFNEIYPNFRIEVIEGTDTKVETLLRNGTVDIALGIEPCNSSDFNSIPWERFSCCAIMREDSAWYEQFKEQDVITVRDLAGIPLVLENKEFKVHTLLEKCCEEQGIIPNIYYETVEIDFAHTIAASGRAMGISVTNVVANSHYQSLCFLPVQKEIAWNWCFLTRKNEVMPEVVKTLIHFLQVESRKQRYFN